MRPERKSNNSQAHWTDTTFGNVADYITSGSRDWSKYYSDHGAYVHPDLRTLIPTGFGWMMSRASLFRRRWKVSEHGFSKMTS